LLVARAGWQATVFRLSSARPIRPAKCEASMAKEKVASTGSFIQELFQVGLYKRSQGKVTRQVTFVAAAIVVALGTFRLLDWLSVMLDYALLSYLIAGTVLFLGCWIAYRVVNYPQFADFLIAVEAEMAKVSWPNRAELIRSAIVVIVVIFVLASILFCYDIFWNWFFTKLQILQEVKPQTP
jgi:preprotein translocase subunit SecE